MALIISSLERGGGRRADVSISRSSTATGMSGSVSGGGLFNISLKYMYSAHCASCVSSDINSFSIFVFEWSVQVLSRLPTNLFCYIVQHRLVSFMCCFFCLSRHIFEVFCVCRVGSVVLPFGQLLYIHVLFSVVP